MRKNKSDKAMWMRKFLVEATSLGAKESKLFWADAEYYYSIGTDPIEAARKKFQK